MADVQRASATLSPEQIRLVGGVREAALVVDDAAEATEGCAASMGAARRAVADGGHAADELGLVFEQMGRATLVESRPLAGLTEPLAAGAGAFRRLATSLTDAGDSLADNARDTARVGADLRGIRRQLDALAAEIEAFRPVAAAREGLRGLELGIRLLLGLIVLEATLSALTGLALILVADGPPAAREPAVTSP